MKKHILVIFLVLIVHISLGQSFKNVQLTDIKNTPLLGVDADGFLKKGTCDEKYYQKFEFLTGASVFRNFRDYENKNLYKFGKTLQIKSKLDRIRFFEERNSFSKISVILETKKPVTIYKHDYSHHNSPIQLTAGVHDVTNIALNTSSANVEDYMNDGYFDLAKFMRNISSYFELNLLVDVDATNEDISSKDLDIYMVYDATTTGDICEISSKTATLPEFNSLKNTVNNTAVEKMSLFDNSLTLKKYNGNYEVVDFPNCSFNYSEFSGNSVVLPYSLFWKYPSPQETKSGGVIRIKDYYDHCLYGIFDATKDASILYQFPRRSGKGTPEKAPYIAFGFKDKSIVDFCVLPSDSDAMQVALIHSDIDALRGTLSIALGSDVDSLEYLKHTRHRDFFTNIAFRKVDRIMDSSNHSRTVKAFALSALGSIYDITNCKVDNTVTPTLMFEEGVWKDMLLMTSYSDKYYVGLLLNKNGKVFYLNPDMSLVDSGLANISSISKGGDGRYLVNYAKDSSGTWYKLYVIYSEGYLHEVVDTSYFSSPIRQIIDNRYYLTEDNSLYEKRGSDYVLWKTNVTFIGYCRNKLIYVEKHKPYNVVKTVNNVGADDRGNITVENPTGLERITEAEQTGWRLIGRDSLKYGNIGVGAVDFSYNPIGSTVAGATGKYSSAFGEGTFASHPHQLVIGRYNSNLGEYNAQGEFGKPLFLVGNGETDSTRTNAFEVFDFGLVNIPHSLRVGVDAFCNNLRATGNTLLTGKVMMSDMLILAPRTLPTAPQKGEIVFDNADNKLKFYDGTSWHNLY